METTERADICVWMNLLVYVRSSSTRGENRKKRRWCGVLLGSSRGKRLAMVRGRKPVETRLISSLTSSLVCVFALGVHGRHLSHV